MKAHFQTMASYSTWANRQVLANATVLSDEQRARDVGVYFKSLFATLSHLLQSDRAWTFLLQGGALADMVLPAPARTFDALCDARRDQDAAFMAWVDGLDSAWFDRPFRFVSGLGQWKGHVYDGTHGSTLTHVLNHGTHHRGQAHAALTILGVAEPNALDIIVSGVSWRLIEDHRFTAS